MEAESRKWVMPIHNDAALGRNSTPKAEPCFGVEHLHCDGWNGLKWTVFCPWMHGFSGCGSKMGCRWTHKSDLCTQIMTPIHKSSKSSKPPQRHSRLPQRDHAANPWLNKSLHQNYCPALILQTCISRQNPLRWRTRTIPYKKLNVWSIWTSSHQFFSALFIFLLVTKPENSNNQQLLRKNLCVFLLVSWGGRWNESAAQMSTSGLQGQWLEDSSKNHRSSQYHEAHARNPALRGAGLVHNMPHFVDFQLLSLTNWFPKPTCMTRQTNVVEFGHCQWIYWQSSIIFADVESTSDSEFAWIFGSHLSPSSH